MLTDLKAQDSDINASSYHDAKGSTLLHLDYPYLLSGVDFVQITRDALENVLYDHAKDQADYRFSVGAQKITKNDSGVVQVEFTDGKEEEFDVVIGTDEL